ncbi:MAG TPA: fatty acid CoA ligase family protein [Lacipirellulaceae bacterium]|nr:fatty acid CoA ligase family protein [Lacipirellulaceae bacterium]
MTAVETVSSPSPTCRLNVADRLTTFAGAMPDAIAVACPRRGSAGRHRVQRKKSGAAYTVITFAELDRDATRIARGLAAWGVPPGSRLALLVQPGIEFVTLVFALLRAGMVIVLVDPGLGRRHLAHCFAEAAPEGFVAISWAQAIRALLRRKFPRARWNVTVGRRWFWGGTTFERLRIAECGLTIDRANPQSAIRNPQFPETRADDPAAIIFTSGSTGPAKGVLYTQRMFDTQVEQIQAAYDIEPGGVDLSCFPLFGLFNAAMGVTTVLPEMNFSRPASASATKLLKAANDWGVTQAFASPAVWHVVSEHCAQTGDRIDSLRQVFSCGAPVPANVQRATLACVGPGAKMHTPYGATECLPVSTIESAEVLSDTAARTDVGAGVCVGQKFDSIEWRVIRIRDEPIARIEETEEMSVGEIGELIVRGAQVSPCYITRTEFNHRTKIRDERAVSSVAPAGGEDAPARCNGFNASASWHRTGDVGYFDESGRFWYCGRKSQRLVTRDGTLFTECVEAIFNTHPAVRRCALVGIGSKGNQTPVIVVERKSCWSDGDEVELHRLALSHKQTASIHKFIVVNWSLPVDVRHNAKINREKLAVWAAKRLAGRNATRSVAAVRSHAERGNEG